MSKDKQLLDKVKNLIPINELKTNLQMQLLERAVIVECKKSRYVFKQGDKDNYSYYLLDGEVEFYADKELNSVITSGSDRANYALAQLQPRQFSAKAKTPLKILQLDRGVLDQLLILSQETTSNPTLTGGIGIDSVEDNDDWMTKMLQSELFSRMPMANMHQLFASLEPVNYKKGDIVIQQGDVGEYYFIISEGRCAVSRKPSLKSKNIRLAEFGAGDSFGEEALISNAKRNATVTMLTDGVLMRLGKDMFIELIKNPTLNSVSFAEASEMVSEGAQWLDLRFPNEHQESAIKGSVNIPLNSLRLQIEKLNNNKPYILYCDTGGRSSTGAFLMTEHGFDVSFLDGGLVNNVDAVSDMLESGKPVKTPAPTPAKVEDEEEPVDAEVRVEMLNAELETTQIKMQLVEMERQAASADVKKKEELEENREKLAKAQKRLAQQKKQAEAEAKKRMAEEEARLKKLQQEASKRMREGKKQLEDIYNKNAIEMEKLQKLREESEATMHKEREKLEQQALEAKKQMEEAERLEKEIKASKKQLEVEAEKKKQQQQQREQEILHKAKEKIAAERMKLAEQLERNTREFEQLQKEKTAAEAARQAAKEEASKIIQEYRRSHEKDQVERQKLEEESQKIHETMKQIQQAKLNAEQIKQATLSELQAPKEKQQESTSTKEQRMQLEEEIQAAEENASQADMINRIREKARQAKKDAAKKNTGVLDEVEQQLGKSD